MPLSRWHVDHMIAIRLNVKHSFVLPSVKETIPIAQIDHAPTTVLVFHILGIPVCLQRNDELAMFPGRAGRQVEQEWYRRWIRPYFHRFLRPCYFPSDVLRPLLLKRAESLLPVVRHLMGLFLGFLLSFLRQRPQLC